MEYSKLAKGHVTSTGGATTVVLPFAPDYVEMLNYTAMTTPASGGVAKAYWDVQMGQGYAAYDVFNATPVLTTAVTTSNGITTFSGGIALQFGAQIAISGITKASPAVVTCTGAHGLVSGNVVVFQGLLQSSTTGMTQICGMPFMVTVTGSTTFTIPWNTNQSNYTALSASPSGAYVKKVLYPNLYVPGVSFVSAISTGSTTAVTTTAPHNFAVGQEVAFRIPTVWGTTQLNSLPNSALPGSPKYGYVTAVGSSTTCTVNIDSTSYTAFNSNQTIASVPGLNFPQIVAVGDNNTGSLLSGSTSPTFYNGTGTGLVSSINGPTVAGAFAVNTSQGFTIGSTIAGASSDVIYWRAYIHDYST